MRIGQGYDVHRFEAGRRLVLCGVEFPGEPGLQGHSDADVALHAVCDAVLGAAALGDIGDHFPPDNDRWRDADSGDLLQEVVVLVGRSYSLVNIDVTIVAERPMIKARRLEMRERLAELVQLSVDRVSIKATTNEGLGSIGRAEGIAALAVALLEERT
jgi:2-C-methyl-D-erythritol 2,4-cyclodiphosphate synthase